jgi:hypothetical protein
MNVDSPQGPIIVFRDPMNPTSEGSAGSQSAKSSDDKDYFRGREQEERAAAKAAASTFARAIHQELAQLYATHAFQPNQTK